MAKPLIRKLSTKRSRRLPRPVVGVWSCPLGRGVQGPFFSQVTSNYTSKRAPPFRAHTTWLIIRTKAFPLAEKDKHRHHLLVARGLDDIAITGRGVIDGQGPAFWKPQAHDRAWIYAKEERVIPMVEIDDCRDVLIDGITLRESPGWTLHLQCCDRARLTGIRIDNHRQGPNNDGFDINGCRDVMISDCHIDTCDDAIVMKTTHNTRSCERITIQNCVLGCNCSD